MALVGASRVGALAGSDSGCGDGGPRRPPARESEAPRGTGQSRAPLGTGAPSNLPFFRESLSPWARSVETASAQAAAPRRPPHPRAPAPQAAGPGGDEQGPSKGGRRGKVGEAQVESTGT